ncbi:MAG TPA: hypothetical protein VIX41_10030 [Acidimicrobiales bacterium]
MPRATELAELIRPDVAAALAVEDPGERTRALQDVFRTAYVIASAELDVDESIARGAQYVVAIHESMDQTVPDGSTDQIERIASILATAATNGVVASTVGPDEELVWHTMRDDRVRELHVPMHGVTAAPGQPFNVGGWPLFYPGQPVGPPEVWINCRCSLDVQAAVTAAGEEPMDDTTAALTKPYPWEKGDDDDCPEGQHRMPDGSCMDDDEMSAATDELVARTYDAETRQRMASRGTAMPDGSFPIADLEDLRNAIQAIGRAKNPDAVKRHIRKRARALGHVDLIPDSWTAAAEASVGASGGASAPAESLVAVDTHDAPGWLTHPVDTQRLRNYWTKGAGAGKIRWGMPGDFNRCRRQLGKYIANPAWLAGTCANLHYVALGFWPGQGPHASGAPIEPPKALSTPEGETVTAAFAAAAELESELPPLEMFTDPGLTAATPMTVNGDELVGHLATWGTCHVGIEGACTTAPRSAHDYAYFRTGEVETAGGPVPVGQITMDTGHAPREADPRSTVAHYDDTGTVVADVAAGEDEHGIWIHGMLRPGVTDVQRRALRAGALSGDWRRIAGNLELVAALVVNVPGFPIPRAEMAASADVPISLVAAAVVVVDPNAERIATLVVSALDAREGRALRHERVEALRAAARQDRIDLVREMVEA